MSDTRTTLHKADFYMNILNTDDPSQSCLHPAITRLFCKATVRTTCKPRINVIPCVYIKARLTT